MNKALVGAGVVGVLAIALAASYTEPAAPTSNSASAYTATETQTPYLSTQKVETDPDAIEQTCNPNYSGCLKPDASDYDCAGGSGNGPYYTGTVQVLGYDEYGLDRDKDGWGCE